MIQWSSNERQFLKIIKKVSGKRGSAFNEEIHTEAVANLVLSTKKKNGETI